MQGVNDQLRTNLVLCSQPWHVISVHQLTTLVSMYKVFTFIDLSFRCCFLNNSLLLIYCRNVQYFSSKNLLNSSFLSITTQRNIAFMIYLILYIFTGISLLLSTILVFWITYQTSYAVCTAHLVSMASSLCHSPSGKVGCHSTFLCHLNLNRSEQSS